tara:strand:- start:150 stop:605 length:456 start_codon:yes stop_codon:yes gene_type:complete
MSNNLEVFVKNDSFVTLNYRLSTHENLEIISTYSNNPATLLIGSGQLASFLEKNLLNLKEGDKKIFIFPPEKAFGFSDPVLIRKISWKLILEDAETQKKYNIGDIVIINGSLGRKFSGILINFDTEYATLDFNHPLSGKNLKFEVDIISIL